MNLTSINEFSSQFATSLSSHLNNLTPEQMLLLLDISAFGNVRILTAFEPHVV
jgi:hypothetical protein